MRAILLFCCACATAVPTESPPVDPRLLIARDSSTGSVTARRWSGDRWVEGDATLAIAGGELTVSGDVLETLTVDIAPIDLPDTLFGVPAQLTDVRVSLRHPATGPALDLDLQWAIAVEGGTTPLATIELPPIDADIAVSDDEVALRIAGAGERWRWAGLLELTRLELVLDAVSVARAVPAGAGRPADPKPAWTAPAETSSAVP
jgi:hypothetical protein